MKYHDYKPKYYLGFCCSVISGEGGFCCLVIGEDIIEFLNPPLQMKYYDYKPKYYLGLLFVISG